MVLLVNGYDVTVPILRENATDFCKSVSSKLTGGASGTTIPTDKDESTEAPKTSNSSEKYNPELETTESATRNTETDIPSSTVDPLNSPTKSRISATTSAQESDLPTDMPNSSESPSKSKYPTKKPSSTSPTKHTATVGSITTTEDDSALTTSSVDVEGKSHDVSQILADNSQAWASYSSYIEDLHSRLSKRVPNTQLDKITTTKEPKPSKSSTTSADTPPESKIKLVARQQRYTSQAAGMRGLIPRFRVPCVWRRIGLGYELHDTNEVEQVQGFSITSSRNKHKDSLGYHLHDSSTVEQVQGFSPKPPAQKREWTYNLGKGGELGIAKAQDEEQDDTETETTDPEPAPTTSKDASKPTFGFVPHPHPAPSTTASPSPPSSSPPRSRLPSTTSTLTSHTPMPTSSARPSTTGNATHERPSSDTSIASRPHWPRNPFAHPIFWGVGAWYLGMAYWEGWRQARGEMGWRRGWTDGVGGWVGGFMLRYF
ncbi:hypothetical protein PMIN02_002109 [Paraphaeosphaeria minitans]